MGNEAVRFDGQGRSYGMEVLAQRRLYKGVYGLLAYTWVRSEYEFDGTYAPSAWDSQAHRFAHRWRQAETGLGDWSPLVVQWRVAIHSL